MLPTLKPLQLIWSCSLMTSYPRKPCNKCGISSKTNQELCGTCRKVCTICGGEKSLTGKQCRSCYSAIQSQTPDLYTHLHTKTVRERATVNLNSYYEDNGYVRIITCPVCQKEFKGRKEQKYCSHKCFAIVNGKSKRNKKSAICQICEKEFESANYRDAKYCSRTCWNKRNPPIKKSCLICNIEFETRTKDQKTCSKKCSHKWRSIFLVGDKSPAWKDGKSLERDRLRLGREVKDWRLAVFIRDGYTCQHCGAKGDLHAHHIKPWAKYPDVRFDINNGLTLCIDCHGKVHNKDFRKRVQKNKICPICGGVMAGRGKSCNPCAMKIWHDSQGHKTKESQDSIGVQLTLDLDL